VAKESGTIRFQWTGDRNFSAEGSVMVTVT
jgi:hypothetical protein